MAEYYTQDISKERACELIGEEIGRRLAEKAKDIDICHLQEVINKYVDETQYGCNFVIKDVNQGYIFTDYILDKTLLEILLDF